MITFNTITPGNLLAKKYAVKSKQQNNVCSNTVPVSSQNINFGAQFRLIQGSINRDRYLGNHIEFEKPVTAKNLRSGNHVTAPEIDVAKNAVLGDKNTVNGLIHVGKNLSAGEWLTARQIVAYGNVSLGENAYVENKIDAIGGNFSAKDGLNTRYLDAGADVSLGNDSNIEKTLTAAGIVTGGDYIDINTLDTDKDVVLGDDVFIETADVGGKFKAGNELYAKTFYTHKDMTVGDDVFIGLVKRTNNFTAGNRVNIDGLIAEGDVDLGTIQQLNIMHFSTKTLVDELGQDVEDPEDNGLRVFKFDNTEMPDEKIKIVLDSGITSLQLQPKKVDPNILDKFVFFEFFEDKDYKLIDPKDKESGFNISVKYPLSRKK